MRYLNLILVFLAGCGGDFNRKAPTKTTQTPLGGTSACPVGYHVDQATPMGTACIPDVIINGVQQNGGGGVYGANASVPSSYTFLDTPDANLCLDAFIRQGTPVPDTATARTINSFNTHANGVALQDMGEQSLQPIVNILTLESKFSNVVFQLLNPNGYYCIIRNQAACSNVTIQRRCTAKVAQIEPITQVTVNNSVVKKHCFWWQWNCNADDVEGTQVSVNSRITETPCIP